MALYIKEVRDIPHDRKEVGSYVDVPDFMGDVEAQASVNVPTWLWVGAAGAGAWWLMRKKKRS